MRISNLKRWLVGQPLSSDQLHEEKIPKWKALAVLSSDALSSTAYATEEILIPLAIVSTYAVAWTVPVSLAIVTLLAIVAASYRQTIMAYPNGGGAYVVAKENLGIVPALTAGASLLIGYVLTVSVSVAAGVAAITSAFPELGSIKILIAGVMILLLTVLNLRGIRESATFFAYPTYVFIFSFFAMLVYGGYRILSGDVVAAAPVIHESYPGAVEGVTMFLIFRAFSSGCAALTGIEAISNGVPAFKDPGPKNAQITLTWMAVILSILFFGITSLTHVYGIMPSTEEIAVSQLARAVFGTNFFYYLVQVSTALILFLAANTSYNGLPWLAAIIADDRYMPRQFAARGDRLVFSNSIIGLGAAAFFLIVIFDGETHSLIPLYAVGVFLGFTLSQFGMVRHHLSCRQKGWRRGMAINLLGAATTFVVMLIVGATKFLDGAWIVILLIPCLVFVFNRIHCHYLAVGKELTLDGVTPPERLEPYRHTAIVPISGMHRGVIEALKYALSISDDVRAVYVDIDEERARYMKSEWDKWGQGVALVILKSPYRSVTRPLIKYIEDVDQSTPGDVTTVVLPEFVTKKWWHVVLHNQTALVIRAALAFKPRKVVTTVRYHLKDT